MTTDTTELIARAKAGDDAAWQQLYEQYYIFVYHTAFGILGDHYLAEDEASEVFLSLFEDKDLLDADLSLAAFLKVKTKNLAIDIIRKHNTLSKRARDYQQGKGHFHTPRPMEDKELGLLLNAAIASIPGSQRRKTFELAYLEELPQQEIARLLNIQQQTVKNHIYQAVKYLREKLKKLDIR